MNSVRTDLSLLETQLFKLFMEANDMEQVHVGHYADRVNNFQVDNKICYAYSNSDTKAVASMTYIKLKYGSIEQAFRDYKNAVNSSDINDTYFNWTP